MAMRGIHFAIEDRHLETLRSLSGEEDMFDYVGELAEELFHSGFDAETDKAWGLIHQTLINENPCANDLVICQTPLSYVIMGEERLSKTDWFSVNLTTSAAIPSVQEQLESLGRIAFENRLRSLLQIHKCPGIGEGDVEYAGYWFEHVERVFKAAYEHGRHVIFTVDY